jgi:hypothetical protein
MEGDERRSGFGLCGNAMRTFAGNRLKLRCVKLQRVCVSVSVFVGADGVSGLIRITRYMCVYARTR